MPTVEETILIKRNREDVFDFASDPENVLLYSSNLIEFEQTSPGPAGKGTTNRGVVKVAGKKFEWTSEITEFDRGRRWASRSVESPMAWSIEINYEDDAGDTLVHWRQEAESYGGFFGKLADPLVTRMYAKDVKSNLEKMKELLEA
jgi:carbon monoxide dehydrogenase subunit G